MAFEDKSLSEITDEDLINLIGAQKANLRLDFKGRYHGSKNDHEKYKREICKDVSAMANAEGGYIIVGVESDNNKIAQDFLDIPDAGNEIENIYDICYQHIDPRIAYLEIQPHSFKLVDKDYNLIIIHIPFSVNRPHGFRSNGTLNFVKRYGNIIKEYRREEFINDLLNNILVRNDVSSLYDIRTKFRKIESHADILKIIGGSE